MPTVDIRVKVQGVVARALRLLGVKDFNESINADEMQVGIDVLNQMLTRWESDGIALGFYPVSTVSQYLPVPNEALEAVQFNLALILAPEYGVAPSEVVVRTSQDGYAALLRDSIKDSVQQTALDLPGAEASYGYNINSDV